jgi:two-component system response regulator NreC
VDADLARSLHSLAEQEQRPPEEVAAELLAFALAHRSADEINLQCWRSLSAREQQVAALVCLGYTNRQIAARLVLSQETVRSHVRNVLVKFALHSKAELRRALADWDFSAWEQVRF